MIISATFPVNGAMSSLSFKAFSAVTKLALLMSFFDLRCSSSLLDMAPSLINRSALS